MSGHSPESGNGTLDSGASVVGGRGPDTLGNPAPVVPRNPTVSLGDNAGSPAPERTLNPSFFYFFPRTTQPTRAEEETDGRRRTG